MRLYLASHNLGPYSDELLKLVGEGRKALFIENARDYYPDVKRANDLHEKLAMISALGFAVEELNLRNYFGKPAELKAFLESYRPDLIFASGGNVFLLATAYRLSGFDEILREDLANDKYVYGGFSAGTMVICKTIEFYGFGHLVPEVVPEIYGVNAVFDGVGLIDYQLVPHANVPKWIDGTKEFIRRIEAAGLKAQPLNQEAVIIVDNNGQHILAPSNEEKRNSVKNDYDLIAAQYGNDFGTFIEDTDIYEVFEKELPEGATILDLGAGTGRTYAYFNERGYEYIGLDFSSEMKNEAFKIHGEFPYICDDMVNIKNHFKNDSVDAIFAVYSLFHLPQDDLQKVLSDAYDILKKDGVIMLSYQLGAGEEFTDEPYLGENGKSVLYMSYQAEDEIESFLKSLGFVDVYRKEKVETVDGAINSNNATTVFKIMRKA